MRSGEEFFNLYNHDLVRVAIAIPSARVADPAFNAEHTLALLQDAARADAILTLFPELGLCGLPGSTIASRSSSRSRSDTAARS